ncbi:ADP-ribose pyrophosphatase [Blastocystis sp. subtype 4]|uniref:ADP-ribose pyrophosphatase n=1 Tax=Blastocystis sp. subtype 4 TaxID=944170 RepID=UPI0007116D20|nr:ADP-ribose pyrophosphatase [Blastocystis sp. subtype 4]KNB42324.1 ADP-ribose pyrophosphatase [Blastocystis sp. subtype 4]|eukprot:XP_014525767.1 ADP-ribose pyrophosphatase [Blastocystis sp. subtype 4]
MNKCIDSLSNTEDRKIQWKYTGKFLQIGEVIYKNPVSGAIQTYECIRRITKTQIGSKYKEPHVLLIHCYRPAFETYVMSLPAGLVDPGETPLDASLRELKEETGYTGTHMNVRMKTLFHLLAGLVDSVLFGSVEKQ